MINVMKKGIVQPFLLFLASVSFIISVLVILDNQSRTTKQITLQTASPFPKNDTESWKTHTNQVFKYEIKYPSNWKIDLNNKNKEKNTVTITSPDLKYSEDSGYPSNGAEINLDSEKSNFSNIEDLFKNVSRNWYTTIHSKSYLTIDGNEALRLNVSLFEGSNDVDTIYFIKDRMLYTLSFWEINTDYSETFDQILSTFKFLDQPEEAKACGTIAGLICPSGYECLYDGDYPDAGGKCVKN